MAQGSHWLGFEFPKILLQSVDSQMSTMIVTDGAFAETRELIGGYAILQARWKEEAIEPEKQFMKLHGTLWD